MKKDIFAGKKLFMNKISGEMAVSFSPRSLWFEDDSEADWCNQYVFIGYI